MKNDLDAIQAGKRYFVPFRWQVHVNNLCTEIEELRAKVQNLESLIEDIRELVPNLQVFECKADNIEYVPEARYGGKDND